MHLMYVLMCDLFQNLKNQSTDMTSFCMNTFTSSYRCILTRCCRKACSIILRLLPFSPSKEQMIVMVNRFSTGAGRCVILYADSQTERLTDAQQQQEEQTSLTEAAAALIPDSLSPNSSLFLPLILYFHIDTLCT